jgi:DNA-binding MarR family transcriptional regulator
MEIIRYPDDEHFKSDLSTGKWKPMHDAAAATTDSETAQSGHLLYLVKQVEQAIRAHLDDLLRPLGLTTAQYTALSVLERRDGLTSAELARRSFVRPQTMHEMITALDERGFIERRRDPGNGRVLLISLTPQGRAMLEAYDQQVQLLEDRMLAGITPRRRADLASSLAACRHALSHRP